MSTTTLPRRFDIVPGRLAASVHHLTIPSCAGDIPCWVYLSEGLRAHGHREIAFALRRHESEDPEGFPADPVHLFASVLRLAEQGHRVDSGGFSELGEKGMFGDPSLRGIGYLRVHPAFGLPAPPDALVAIALVGVELDFAKRHGITRVMTRLGDASRQYPCPAWHERGRPAQVAPTAIEQTLLRNVASVFFGGATVSRAASTITLRLPASRIAEIRASLAQLPPNLALAILTDLDVRADAYLCWQPGQEAPSGIAPAGSAGATIAGTFALFAPEQARYGAQLIEDGFAVSLPQPMWIAVREAISSGQRWSHPPTEQAFGVVIEWDTAAGAPPIAGPGAAVAGDLHVRLHNSSAELDARLPGGGFGEYMEALERALQSTAKGLPPQRGQDVHLTVTLQPGGSVEIQVMAKPGMDPGALHTIHASLVAVPAPPVTEGSVGLNGVMALWGGTGAPLDPS